MPSKKNVRATGSSKMGISEMIAEDASMESQANVAMHEGHHSQVKIDVDIDLILGVYEVGGKGNPSKRDVPIGRIAVLSHDQEASDYQGMPEVYIAGETITENPFLRGNFISSLIIPKAQFIVAELAEYPGRVSVKATQWLAGLSLTENDLASAEFLYDLRIEDPIRLLSTESKWMTPNGQAHLKTAVENLVQSELASILSTDIDLWSHVDSREVAGRVLSSLDQKLRTRGLRVDNVVGPIRRYPGQLFEVVLQFKIAERHLMVAGPEERRSILQALGLEQTSWIEIQNVSQQKASGAGLFVAAQSKRSQIVKFVEWLTTVGQSPSAARFLKELYSGEHSAKDVALTEYVVLSSFANPILGVGEWGDVDETLREKSEYRQMERFLDVASQ